MGVFDGKVQVPLAVPDPKTDAKLPPPGALQYGAITTAAALAGTTGVHAALIHGNKWQQLNGSHTENVSVNHQLKITGNRKETVAGNHRHTIVGTTVSTHHGVHHHQNTSARNDLFLQHRTEQHAEKEFEQQTTQRMEHLADEVKEIQNEKHIKGFEWSIIALKTEATGTGFETKVTSTSVIGIVAEAKGSISKSEAFEHKLQGFVTSAVGMATHACSLYGDLIALDLNGGVKIDGDSPGG